MHAIRLLNNRSQSSGWGVFFLLWYLLACNTLSAATFTVMNTSDSGPFSLRQAIIDSNLATPGPNTIDFAIPGTGPFRIQPLTDLPAIIVPVLIDGYSQPGATTNTLTNGATNAVLQIELNGSNYLVGDGVTTGIGLNFEKGSDASEVRGLVINEWLLAGILINDSGNQTIDGNFIGTNVAGTSQLANKTGVLINNSSVGNTIGFAIQGVNLFAGSFSEFLLGSCITLFHSVNDVISHNLIGTDKTGSLALGNSVGGIFCAVTMGTQIKSNVISGHTIYGVSVDSVNNSFIFDNLIGTDLTGSFALGNQNAGISLTADAAPCILNIIKNNTISGNGKGVVVGSPLFNLGTSQNSLLGNFIGTDFTGTYAIGNTEHGVWVLDSGNVIGGIELEGLGNLISGNGGNGILVSNSAMSTQVLGNFIGTDVSGTKPLGNRLNGIQLGLAGGNNSAPSNFIGNELSGGNVICSNAQDGIRIQSFSSNNTIQGNYIGINHAGDALPNGRYGIEIIDSANTLIGSDSITGTRNIIVNNLAGVVVGRDKKDRVSQSTVILTNSIFANQTLGILLHKTNSGFANQALGVLLQKPFKPKITSAKGSSSSTIVSGSIHGCPSSTFLIQFFNTPNPDPGQGELFLNQIYVETDRKGRASFTVTLEPLVSPAFITATATHVKSVGLFEGTSEFSNPVAVAVQF
jgi:hypothetical protein